MTGWRNLQPDELEAPGTEHDPAGAAEAMRLARELESAAILDPVQTSSEFVDTVMAAIEREPAPRAAVAIVGPIRRRGLFGFVESVRAAVALTTLGAGRPLGARALALAYLLVVGTVALGLGGGAAVGAAGALGLLDDRGPAPTPIVLPSASPSPDASIAPSLGPSPSPSPSGSDDPSSSPDGSTEPSGSPSGSTSPTKSPSPSGSPDESESPDPSDTPKPSRTPRASDSPEPSESP